MVELILKADPIRLNWFSLDDAQSVNSEVMRWRMTSRSHIWRPPTDVYETDDTIVVRMEIAGMNDADFTVILEDRFLLIRGVRSDTLERRAYQQMEIPFGEFVSEIGLPGPVAVDEIEAVYRDGFLRIVFPKLRPQQVRVGDKDFE